MDAISSLRSLLTPGAAGGMASMVQDAAKAQGQTISPAEMAKLDTAPTLQVSGTQAASGSSFDNLLGNMVSEVSQKQTDANDTVKGLLSGQNVSLHQAMISMEEANVSFQMMVEVRNKLLDSYQELMKMQI